MIKSKHKIISVLLCTAIVLGACFAVTVTASAPTGNVYVRIPSSWSKAYCYMWGGSSGANGTWPGVQMSAASESGVFSYAVNGDYTNIIFNNGEQNGNPGVTQTSDLSFSSSNLGQICDLTKDISKGSWSAYGGNVSDPTTPTTPTTPSTGTTVYLKNTKNWGSPYCYMWNSDSDKNASWAGDAMTALGDDIWMYTASKTFANCIFSDTKSGNDQTADLAAKDGQIYDPKTNKWETYDPSPLRVKSFSATHASDIYTGTEVTLSAEATSTEGAVSYKFSANDTVIRNYAAGKTTTWTPTAAGTYTIKFDFKDVAGNENTRTLQLTVQSDSGVTSPIIKKVTPSENGYVQTGKDNTISVTAAGGKTGTNLLFYKYIIQDSTGKQLNTAYYTLNSTYTFKPTANGSYKILVTVQASDNSEASRVVNVTAAGTIPTDPTEPTIVTQPTQPTQPTTSPDQYEVGDVNKDGYIDIKDATQIMLFINGFDGNDVETYLGDVNKDGKVNILDVTEIQRIIAQI